MPYTKREALKFALQQKQYNTLQLLLSHDELIQDVEFAGYVTHARLFDGYSILGYSIRYLAHHFVAWLLEQRVVANEADAFGYTPLMYAVRHNNEESALQFMRRLLALDPTSGSTQDKNGNTLLMQALMTRAKDSQVIEFVVNAVEEEVNAANNKGQTTLMIAAQHAELFVLSMILEKKFARLCQGNTVDEAYDQLVLYVNQQDKQGMTALHYAALHHSDPKVIELLIQHGALVDASNKQQRTPLHLAVTRPLICDVVTVLENPLPDNAKSAVDNLYLMLQFYDYLNAKISNDLSSACKIGTNEIEEFDNDQQDALNLEKQNELFIEDLTTEQLVQHIKTDFKSLAIEDNIRSLLSGRRNLRLLLDKYPALINLDDFCQLAERSIVPEDKKNIKRLLQELLMELLEKKALTDEIHEAYSYENELPPSTTDLIDRSRIHNTHFFDFRQEMIESTSEIYPALSSKYASKSLSGVDVVIALIKNHANVNSKDQWGCVPLHCAAQNACHPDIITALLGAEGANDSLSATDDVGYTPFHYAVQGSPKDERRRQENIRLLVQKIPPQQVENILMRPDVTGRTALFYAAHSRYRSIVPILLPHHVVDDSMHKALIDAAMHCDAAMVKILLQRYDGSSPSHVSIVKNLLIDALYNPTHKSFVKSVNDGLKGVFKSSGLLLDVKKSSDSGMILREALFFNNLEQHRNYDYRVRGRSIPDHDIKGSLNYDEPLVKLLKEAQLKTVSLLSAHLFFLDPKGCIYDHRLFEALLYMIRGAQWITSSVLSNICGSALLDTIPIGVRLLLHAIEYDDVAAYELLSKKTPLNIEIDGVTPSMCAVMHENWQALNMLTGHGADLHYMNKQGETAFTYFCMKYNRNINEEMMQIAMQLILHQVPLGTHHTVDTLLSHATQNGHTSLVQELLLHYPHQWSEHDIAEAVQCVEFDKNQQNIGQLEDDTIEFNHQPPEHSTISSGLGFFALIDNDRRLTVASELNNEAGPSLF